jgi:undecaprenyl-diphosphatase
MSYFEAAILGILQGLTEYLPVSSSGHLVLAQELFGFNPSGVAFEIVVHLGSLAAVLIYFRKRLLEIFKSFVINGGQQGRRYAYYLILGTIPAAIIGLSFEDFFDKVFASPVITSAFLLCTGIILLSTRFAPRGQIDISWKSALLIGIAQSLAILPGISRSGSTISAGIWSKIDPSKAAEFSFLLSIPAIGGATVLKFKEFLSLDAASVGPYATACLLSFLFSIFAIHWLLAIIRKGRLDFFAYYCFAAGALGLYLFSK